MWIGHRKEIRKLAFRALALRRSCYRIECFFRNVSLVCNVLLLKSMSKLIHNRCTCKLIKTLRLHTCMQTNNCAFVFVLTHYYLLFSSEIKLKQLFPSGSVDIVDFWSLGQTERQVVASGCKLNLHRDLRWVAKRAHRFPRKYTQKKTF